MGDNGHQKYINPKVQAQHNLVMGIQVGVTAGGQIRLQCTQGIDMTDPAHLQEVLTMIYQGIDLIVGNYLNKMTGDGAGVLADVLKLSARDSMSLVRKHVPRLERVLIQEVPSKIELVKG